MAEFHLDERPSWKALILRGFLSRAETFPLAHPTLLVYSLRTQNTYATKQSYIEAVAFVRNAYRMPNYQEGWVMPNVVVSAYFATTEVLRL